MVVGKLDLLLVVVVVVVVMVSVHLKHLIATIVLLTRHAVHDVGLSTAHAVGCEAARMRESMVLLRGGNLRQRVLGGRDGASVIAGVGGRPSTSLGLALNNSAGLATALDSLVAVLVVGGKVLQQLELRLRDFLS